MWRTIVSRPIRIVILGGGTAGWMAANLFVKKWSPDIATITLVESRDIGIIGVGEGSTPSLKRFFDSIGVAEVDWMPRCNATYKTNIRFSGWSPASGVPSYSHPFISRLDMFSQQAFITNCLTRRLNINVHTQPDDFFINAVLARQHKSPLTPPNFPFDMQYGYHFDSHLLGVFLAEVAKGRGVYHRQENILLASLNSSSDISSLLTDRNERIEGDYFIDCSGFSSVLMQKALGVNFKSFKDNLFNDRAVVMPTPISEQIPVETHAQAMSAGWMWKIPLRNRFGNGYVYSADFISPERAELEFRHYLGVDANTEECRHLRVRVGQLESHWVNNCVGVGLAQGFIEPLEATALHLVQYCLELFMEKFEAGAFTPQYRDEFNRRITERFERVRDYIVAHYKLNTREDSEYWRENRNNMKLSDSLLHLLDVWYRRKDLTEEIQRQQISSHFGSESWHCLLAGYGAFPSITKSERHNPRIDLYAGQDIRAFLEGCALNFDSHVASLERRTSTMRY
jgi:hypothetical protein